MCTPPIGHILSRDSGFRTSSSLAAPDTRSSLTLTALKIFDAFPGQNTLIEVEGVFSPFEEPKMNSASQPSPDENGESKRCDGCGDSHTRLLPVGDGSIQVCSRCLAAATAMVFTRNDSA